MTGLRPGRIRLFLVGAVEAIYLLAAGLWIAVVLGALWIGIRVALRVRSRKRRINRLLDAILLPMGLGVRRKPGFATLLTRTTATRTVSRRARR